MTMKSRDTYQIKERPAPPAPMPRTRGLEDPRIKRQIETVGKAFKAIGITPPPETTAAVQAYVEAVKHPGSLIRITMTGPTQDMAVFEAIANADERHRNVDWNKTALRDDYLNDNSKHLLTIEFRNGSGIELMQK